MEIEKENLKKMMDKKEVAEYKIAMIKSTLDKKNVGLLSPIEALNEIDHLINPPYMPPLKVAELDFGSKQLQKKEEKAQKILKEFDEDQLYN